jgi:transposase
MPAARFVGPLSPEQEAMLRDCYRQTEDADLRTRCQMILFCGRGKTVPEIAELTFFGADAVLYWIERYQQEGIGGLAQRPRSGRPRKSRSGLSGPT